MNSEETHLDHALKGENLGGNLDDVSEADKQEEVSKKVLGYTLTSTLTMLLGKKVSERAGASEKIVDYYLGAARSSLYMAIALLMAGIDMSMFLEYKGMVYPYYPHPMNPAFIPMIIGTAAAMTGLVEFGGSRFIGKAQTFLKAASESKTELPKDIKACLGPVSKLFFFLDNFSTKHGRIPTGDPDQDVQPLLVDIKDEILEMRQDSKNKKLGTVKLQ